jgi:hypothetical protein
VAHDLLRQTSVKSIAYLLSLLLLLSSSSRAAELKVSSAEPVVVSAPPQWQIAKVKPSGGPLAFEAYQISPPDGRNAVCLISLLDKNRKEFANPEFLKKLVRADSRPYVNSAQELSNIDVKELKISGSTAFFANFIDPDLVNKPVRKGDYKTATPMVLSLGNKYLFKITILCDEIDGADYRDATKIVQSIKIKNDGT